ncbi:MAG: sensor histidine kinase, partial [Hyphomicrobiales bacterium]|nr:sensor histidine kinase [Hyphomicrobiales bacterium]
MSDQPNDFPIEATPREERRPTIGLSGKLLLLTVLFVMLSEVLIFVPSIANFRMTWLRDRIKTAELAAIVLKSSGADETVSERLRDEMLATIEAKAVVVRDHGMRRLLAMSDMPPPVGHHVDLRENAVWRPIADAFSTLVHGETRTILVIAATPRSGDFIELVLAEAPLRSAMLRYSVNILALSLIISIITATLVYLSLNWLLVRP